MSVRQEKFAGQIQQHLAEIFVRHPEWIMRVFATISKVEVSPDLSYAKVFLSVIKLNDKTEFLNTLQFHNRDIRKALAQKVKNQARIVPELNFVLDESLDYVFHMDEVLKKVHEEDERKRKENNQD